MDMLPVDRTRAKGRLLGTDEITIRAPGDQTGGDIFAVAGRCGGWSPEPEASCPSAAAPRTPFGTRVTPTPRPFVVHSPAAVVEGFSRAVATLVAGSPEAPPPMSEVLAVAQRHGVELLGPLPVPA